MTKLLFLDPLGKKNNFSKKIAPTTQLSFLRSDVVLTHRFFKNGASLWCSFATSALIGLCFLLFPSTLTAQKINFDIPGKDYVMIYEEGKTIRAEVKAEPTHFKPHYNKMYHWYRDLKILQTQGAYEGRLLHGTYKSFHPNKNLHEKGKYRNGLRIGIWKIWHPNGQLKEQTEWKNGVKSGRLLIFSEKAS